MSNGLVAAQLSVRVYRRERHVAAPASLSGVLTAKQVDHVQSVARHRQAWRQVPPAATPRFEHVGVSEAPA
ncbi:hypothetical protein [Streptomyces globosus]|uniref:hypothetical protein n=1 Tax=Streptomyces globosus TaxID=68209 RepID=UPI00382F232E